MKNQTLSILSLITVTLLPGLGFGTSEPQPKRKIETLSIEGKEIVSKSIVEGLNEEVDLTVAGVVIEKSTLPEVLSTFGETTKSVSGDASTSNASICYQSRDKAFIRFNSGEMGGGVLITSIEVASASDRSWKTCKNSEKFPPEITNKRGVKLGLTKKQIQRILGIPSFETKDGDLVYSYISKVSDSVCPQADIRGKYWIKFKKGKVVYFSISQISSC